MNKNKDETCLQRWSKLRWHGLVPDGHICAVSKCAFCKRGMLMFKLLQQQVYRPQTTPVWSGARSQSVNWLAEEQLLHQVTKQIWRGSSSVFIAIMILALKHIGVKLCIESTAVSVFCIPSAREPWKGSFKERVTLHYTLPMGWPLHFLYFCAPVLAFSWGSRRVNLSPVLRFFSYNLWAASQRLCWQVEWRWSVILKGLVHPNKKNEYIFSAVQ